MTTAHSHEGVVVTERARSLLSMLTSCTSLGRLLSAALVTALLALAVRSSFLLLSTGVLLVVGSSGGLALAVVAIGVDHSISCSSSGCSHRSEDVGVGFLQLVQDFLAVLRLRKAS